MVVPSAADAVLGLLTPFWQVLLGCCVLVAVVGAAARLAGRGRSRMNTALLITGAAVLGMMLLGMLTAR